MADLRKSIELIFEADDKASKKAADVIGKINEMEAAAKATAVESDKLAGGLDGIGKKEAGITAAATALKALATGLVVSSFIDANVAFEKFSKSMSAAGFDAQQTAVQFNYVKSVAEKFGIDVFDAADSFAKFSNATKGSAIEGDKARVVFEAFTGTMKRVGANSNDIAGAFVQLSQGVSKGKFEMQDLKSIAERVPGFFVQFANSLGVTTEELFKMVSAGKIGSEEILKFSEVLNKSLGKASFEGYEESMERLKNAIKLAFTDLGQAGAMDVLLMGINAVTATATGAISAIRLFGDTWVNLLQLREDFDFGAFGRRFLESLDKAAASTKSLTEALKIGEDTTKQAGASGAKAGADIAAGMDDAAKSSKDASKQAAELGKDLKDLGVKPEQIKKPLDDLVAAFERMASNPAVRGDQILAGLKAVLKDVKDNDTLAKVMADVVTANAKGALSSTEFAEATKLLDDAQAKLDGTVKKSKTGLEDRSKSLAKQADETRKAEENAQRFRLEMEKLASNERIKNIEAKVSLDIAKLEADTQRVQAAFASINEVVGSTGSLIGDLFGLFKDYDNLSFAAIRKIESQIDLENDRRQQALDLQKKLIEAQVDQLRAQTRALNKGDSIIKVDGAGLQPHLEAFMWEILRTIQVRANQEGLAFLLGQS
jgi:tape measure domain-containing protein